MFLEDTENIIIHLDLDSFFISVERLLDARLREKPVIIGGAKDKGVVASCSYEARFFGVRSAMPIRLAKKLCPHAYYVKGDYEKYADLSDSITEIIKAKVPVCEKSSIDEFYIDMTGYDRFFSSLKLASDLKSQIFRETGLPISYGLSKNKTVSKVATGESKPNGMKHIERGTEKQFLAPLSIKKIPMVGDKTFALLRNMGVDRIVTLQQMPQNLLYSVFGRTGLTIWDKANGIDNSPVVPYSERKSLSAENTFFDDTIDVRALESLLISMTENLCSKLRKNEQLTSCISIKLRYSDFETHTQQIKIAYTSADHIIIPRVKELFHKLYNRRMLVRLIGVRFSHLVRGNYQINLFEDSLEQINLYQALDGLNKKYGDKTVCRAIGMGIKTRNFNPFNGVSNL